MTRPDVKYTEEASMCLVTISLLDPCTVFQAIAQTEQNSRLTCIDKMKSLLFICVAVIMSVHGVFSMQT